MNKNKMLASVMCASTLMTSVLPVFATQTLTNDDLTNLKETEVLYSKSASYMVTIPKTINLGSDKTSTYSVKVEGDISSNQEVYVAPVDAISETETTDFYMEDQSTSALKKDNVVATVTPTKTVWNFEDVANAVEVADNGISAKDLTSGTWRGVFNFDINLKTMSDEAVALEAGLYDANGVMLAKWEELGVDVEKNYTISTYETDTTSPYNTFSNYSLTRIIVVPNGTEKIGSYAFSGLGYKCRDVILPDSVTLIDKNAFWSCNQLESIVLSNNLSTINGNAFENASKISSITIPDSVTYIGDHAFKGCKNLSTVIYKEIEYTSISELITALTNNNVELSRYSNNADIFKNTALTE